MDIAVLADQNILSKEEEKVEKYQDLALEIKRILLSPAIIIIVIIIIIIIIIIVIITEIIKMNIFY